MLSRLVRTRAFISLASGRKVYSTEVTTTEDTGALVTHTGQSFAKDDYRNVRFTDKTKLVNPRFAIDLIAADPVVVCEKRVVWSSGGGALGHPKVFINLDVPEIHSCGYSGRKFILKKYYNAEEHGPSITYEEYMEQMKKSPLY